MYSINIQIFKTAALPTTVLQETKPGDSAAVVTDQVSASNFDISQ